MNETEPQTEPCPNCGTEGPTGIHFDGAAYLCDPDNPPPVLTYERLIALIDEAEQGEA